MFENITAAPADPILGLADIFRVDSAPNKINLGIGVYQNEEGETPILEIVKKVEQHLLGAEKTKNYLGIDGRPDFARYTQALLFGQNSAIINNQRARTAQTPGGTGALRVAADLLAKHTDVKCVWISNPSWPNHKNIFAAAGLATQEYRYYNAAKHTLDFDGMLKSLAGAKSGDVMILHGCCHNPTGVDPTAEQWETLAELFAKQGWLPLFDFAYQGFAIGLEEDAKGLRTFADKQHELIVASSYSKNFGLYNERVGACTLVAKDCDTVDKAFSQVKAVIRANYSNPPAHGASVVAYIFSNEALRAEWERELTAMRERISQMRAQFVDTLQKKMSQKGIKLNFDFIHDQKGMFSFSGLTKEQIQRLRKEFHVHAADSGRINITGMTKKNMDRLCEAVVAVL